MSSLGVNPHLKEKNMEQPVRQLVQFFWRRLYLARHLSIFNIAISNGTSLRPFTPERRWLAHGWSVGGIVVVAGSCNIDATGSTHLTSPHLATRRPRVLTHTFSIVGPQTKQLHTFNGNCGHFMTSFLICDRRLNKIESYFVPGLLKRLNPSD